MLTTLTRPLTLLSHRFSLTLAQPELTMASSWALGTVGNNQASSPTCTANDFSVYGLGVNIQLETSE